MEIDVGARNEDIRKTLNQIAFYDGKARLRVEAALAKGAHDMAKDAKAKVPVDSGVLKRSVFSNFKKVGLEATFGAKKPHAHLIEYGVKQSSAAPKRKKAMRIADTIAIRYTRKSVIIPARPAHPFIEPAFESGVSDVVRDVKKAVQP